MIDTKGKSRELSPSGAILNNNSSASTSASVSLSAAAETASTLASTSTIDTTTDISLSPDLVPTLQSSMVIDDKGDALFYRTFKDEQTDLGGIMRLVEQELSEPYNVYTFRYFIIDWPHLAFLVFPNPTSTIPIATIVCKQDSHRGKTNRGYIAMLSVDRAWRRRGIAIKLAELAIAEMTRRGAHEVVLETEYDNEPSLSLYDKLGFLREKRLHRFYSNHKDAFRLILPIEWDIPPPAESEEAIDRGRWLVGAGSGPDQGFDQQSLSMSTTGYQPSASLGAGLQSIAEDQSGAGAGAGGYEPPRYFTESNGDAVQSVHGTPRPPPKEMDWGMYT